MKFHDPEAAAQCLTDAGCDTETITAFLSCMKADDIAGELAVLESQRARLLDSIHQTQFRIMILDDLLCKAGYSRS